MQVSKTSATLHTTSKYNFISCHKTSQCGENKQIKRFLKRPPLFWRGSNQTETQGHFIVAPSVRRMNTRKTKAGAKLTGHATITGEGPCCPCYYDFKSALIFDCAQTLQEHLVHVWNKNPFVQTQGHSKPKKTMHCFHLHTHTCMHTTIPISHKHCDVFSSVKLS